MPIAYPPPLAVATPTAPYTPGGPVAPYDGGVRGWHFRLADVPDRLDTLSDAERVRAARYARAETRRNFVACRAALRNIIGGLLACPPEAVAFEVAPGGKPTLPGCGWHFNVSHSGGAAVVAAAASPVGIDIEEVRTVPSADGLVARFFSRDEQEAYARLPVEFKPAGFLRAWTCKEALLKATGRGLIDLESCVVELDPRLPPRAIAYDGGPWALTVFEPLPGYVAALAVQSAVQSTA